METFYFQGVFCGGGGIRTHESGLDNRISRPPRYDRFDNPPRLFQSVELKIRPRKKERTTGENKQKYSVVKVQKSLINQGVSGISVPITSTNFKTSSLNRSDISPCIKLAFSWSRLINIPYFCAFVKCYKIFIEKFFHFFSKTYWFFFRYVV